MNKNIHSLLATMLMLPVVPAETAEEFSPIEEPVAFGLYWGMTAKELKMDGVVLDNLSSGNPHIEVYNVGDLPQALGDAKSYKIWLADNAGLQRITVTGEPVMKDQTGDKSKQRYEELKKILGERFGEPVKSKEYSGRRKYEEYYEFNQCLRHSDCGKWATYFRSGGTSVLLQLRAIDRDRGYYELIFEGPEWKDAWLEEEEEQLNVDGDN